MIIRNAILNDLEVIVNFNLNLAIETESKNLDFETVKQGVLKVLNNEVRGKYFVCEINREVVGQMMILYEWSDWRNGEFIWIQSVYVDKNYRNKGVFKLLFEYVKQYCDLNKEIIGMRLYVEKQNINAKKTYHSVGMYKNNYDMFEYMKEKHS